MSKDCKKNIFEKISIESIKNMGKAELVKVGVVGVASLTVVGGAVNAVTAPELLDTSTIEEWNEDTYIENNLADRYGELDPDFDPDTFAMTAPGVTDVGDPSGIPEEYQPMSFEEYLAQESDSQTSEWIDGDDIFATYVRSASKGQLNLDLFHPSVQGNVTMNSDYGFYEGKTFTVTYAFILDPGIELDSHRGKNYDYSYLQNYAPHLTLNNEMMSAYDGYEISNIAIGFEYEENGTMYKGNLKGIYLIDGDNYYFLDASMEYGL